MLEELAISNLGVIEQATLELSPGLTVVTGETGAGKTMVVTALELLLGARADTSLVRAGAASAVASAIVRPVPEGAAAWVDEDADELVVSRELRAEGRSRARVGGSLAPVSALAEVLGRHVEVHAQHEHVRLARPDVQRALLDRSAGDPHARTLDRYRSTHRAWRDLVGRREEVASGARERARELDRLRSEVDEIAAAGLDADRDATLDRDLDVLANAEELQLAAAEAATALGADGAGEPLGVAVAALRRISVDDPTLAELTARASALAAEVTELAVDVRTYGEDVDADPGRLASLSERKAVIQALTRKYGADVSAVLAYEVDARQRLAELEAVESDAGDLDDRCAAARSELVQIAADVTRGRAHAAEALARTVDGHLVDLGMPHASFSVAVEPVDGELTADGGDRVTFLLAANPGEPARPLGTAASGGERSRVSLAVEVALADVDEVEVLVFDEVDAGIGGATAMAVGEKLARLATGAEGRPRQVLCVTHLAQLAAFADVHHVVEKGLRDGRTVTTTRRVADDQRVEELSRMLGGDATAEAGLEHARALLDRARQRRAG
ncbi:MAG: DNA repair protein RecN [Nitriliruptor sp.]|uniref:DNA repair protein RecN n=1 Tax=Nitriliruptor sp. TaxID=2448056 RepID=UPI0034A0282E